MKFIKNSDLVSEVSQIYMTPFCFISIDLGIDTPIVLDPSLVVFMNKDFLIKTFKAANTMKYKNGALIYVMFGSSLWVSNL